MNRKHHKSQKHLKRSSETRGASGNSPPRLSEELSRQGQGSGQRQPNTLHAEVSLGQKTRSAAGRKVSFRSCEAQSHLTVGLLPFHTEVARPSWPRALLTAVLLIVGKCTMGRRGGYPVTTNQESVSFPAAGPRSQIHRRRIGLEVETAHWPATCGFLAVATPPPTHASPRT